MLKKFCCSNVEKVLKSSPRPLEYTMKNGVSFAARYISFCPFCGFHFDNVVRSRLYTKAFCCDGMDCAVDTCDPSDEFDIYYYPWARRYFFSTCREWKWYDETYEEWDFYYCIYCGKKLPTSLLDQWIKVVQDETGMIPKIETQELLDQTLEKLPEELKTDAWWKKRGL